MSLTWKDSIDKQRKALAQILRDPIEQITSNCIPMWKHRESIENLFLVSFSRIPYCDSIYALNTEGIQISESIGRNGIQPGHLGRDRSQHPYLKEAVPAWGFLLSDAYLSMNHHHPSLTALQVVRSCDKVLGYIAADFDLRDLPMTSSLYLEPGEWQHQTDLPLIRNLVYKQSRKEKTRDEALKQTLPVLEELLVARGVFQCQTHFTSNQVTVWTLEDPYRFQVLDRETLTSSDILQDFPHVPYPYNAKIPRRCIARILDMMRLLHCAHQGVYLRLASINIFNGQINLAFSHDDLQNFSYDEFLTKDVDDWFGDGDSISSPASR